MIIKKLLKKYSYLLFCVIFTIINIMYLNNKMPHKITLDFASNTKNIIFIIMVVLEILFCLIIFILNKKNKKIENIFLMVAIPIGLMYLILIPVGQIPDEYSHFKRTYEITEGHLVSDINGRKLPSEIEKNFTLKSDSDNYKNVIKNIQKENSGERTKYNFANTYLYSFVNYIPQTIGTMIGKIFNAPILLQAYLARLFNFIFWIFLIYMAIKFIPFHKEFLILISLLPITIQEGVSLSPDALTYASVVLLISYTLYLKYKKEKVDRKSFVILSVLCTIISLCKIVYLPVCLILVIIPKEKFKSLKDKNIKIFSLAIFVVILNLIWLKVASDLLVVRNSNVIPNEQKQFILSHPFGYLRVVIESIKQNYEFYIYSMTGEMLQIFNVDLERFYSNISICLMVLLIIINRLNDIIISKKEKLIYLFINLSIVFLIFTSLYIQWTPVKNTTIEGVQGRYFLPILLLIPLLFLNTKKRKKVYKFDKINMYVFAFTIFSNICALMYIFSVNS